MKSKSFLILSQLSSVNQDLNNSALDAYFNYSVKQLHQFKNCALKICEFTGNRQTFIPTSALKIPATASTIRAFVITVSKASLLVTSAA